MILSSVALKRDAQGLWILDQTLLPKEERWIHSPNPEAMVNLIRQLKVRGAPLIGVAAALQLGLYVEQGASEAEFQAAAQSLRESRPTAVNLMNALDRLLQVSHQHGLAAVPGAAGQIFQEDIELCLRMAEHGASLIQKGEKVLTHCNSGALATAGLGTALGAIIMAHGQGKGIHVYADETRPLLQGGRLTAWELARSKVPYTLICDNMAGFLMQKGEVQRVLVGADRIAVNGDFANKVGTYSLAVLCRHHGIPFHVVAPQTTVDSECLNGASIPIEERECFEVRGVRGSFGQVEWAPSDCAVWNPAFDVTPAELVTSWVLDRGVFTSAQVRAGSLKVGG